MHYVQKVASILSPTTKMRRPIKIMKTSCAVNYTVHPSSVLFISIYGNKYTFILFFIQTIFLIIIKALIITKFRKVELKYEQNLWFMHE
jgi:hypothetical protein